MEIPTRKDIAVKVVRKLASPADLLKYLEFKFVSGNEYPYFDFADIFPGLATALGLPFRRLDVDSPIFLAGLRRSGTTLLYRIISAHKSLFLFNERFPGDRLNGRGTSTLRNLLYGECGVERFRTITGRYLSPLLRAQYDRWGVKLALELAHPHPGSISAGAMARILAAFPGARVILIVRDPRDFVISALARGGHDVDWWIAEYLAMLNLADEIHKRHEDAVMTVRYEDLVQQPEESVRQCCEFAGLAFDSAMLDPALWPIKGPREYESKAIVTNSAKWKNAVGRDRAVVEKVSEACFPAASRLGYECRLLHAG